MKFNAKP